MMINNQVVDTMTAAEIGEAIAELRDIYAIKCSEPQDVVCCKCGKAYGRAGVNDDGTVVEITPLCDCGSGGRIVTAAENYRHDGNSWVLETPAQGKEKQK